MIEELKRLAIIAILIVIVATLIGAMYGESTGEYIKSSTHGTLLESQGEYLGNVFIDVGHSLKIAWIVTGMAFLALLCVYVYIKTRSQQSDDGYYGYYR